MPEGSLYWYGNGTQEWFVHIPYGGNSSNYYTLTTNYVDIYASSEQSVKLCTTKNDYSIANKNSVNSTLDIIDIYPGKSDCSAWGRIGDEQAGTAQNIADVGSSAGVGVSCLSSSLKSGFTSGHFGVIGTYIHVKLYALWLS